MYEWGDIIAQALATPEGTVTEMEVELIHQRDCSILKGKADRYCDCVPTFKRVEVQ
jgi:hypothetical protein